MECNKCENAEEELDEKNSEQKPSQDFGTASMRRTFRDGIRKIDLIIVVKEQENRISNTLMNNFIVNVIKMGLEVEFEPGVMPIHQHLIFFKIHCPDEVLCKFAYVYGVRCAQSNRANQLMYNYERDWINLIRKEYKEPLQYSSIERSLTVYMILLNLAFGERQNHIGIERLIKRNIVLDVYALHDGPYFFPLNRNVSNVNGRQILFYNWGCFGSMFRPQPLNLIHEYFGPKIAMYFAFYAIYNLFLLIMAIGGIITLLLSLFNNERYMDLIDPLCNTDNYFALDSKEPLGVKWYNVENMRDFCLMYIINTLVDNKFTPFYSMFLMLGGILFTTYWLRREKYLKYVWEAQSQKVIEKLTRPEYDFQRMNVRKSVTTGITLSKKGLVDKRNIFLLYLGLILLCVIECYVFIKVHDAIEETDFFQATFVRIKIMSIIVTTILFVIVLLLQDKYSKRFARYIVEKENHQTYQSYYWSLTTKIFLLSFIAPLLLLIYYGSHLEYYLLWFGKFDDRSIAIFTYGLTAGIYQLASAFTVILLIRFTILRKLSKYLRKTDYNHNAKVVENIPCWEREYLLPPFREENLIDNMKILVIQFIFIIMFAFAAPVIIIIVLCFNIYYHRRNAQLLVLHYRRPLLLKDNAFGFWSWVLKRIIYLSIIIHSVVLMSGTEFLEMRLREQKRSTPATLQGYLDLMYIENFSKALGNIFHMHVFLMNDKVENEKPTPLTVEEYRVYQYVYVFIFEEHSNVCTLPFNDKYWSYGCSYLGRVRQQRPTKLISFYVGTICDFTVYVYKGFGL